MQSFSGMISWLLPQGVANWLLRRFTALGKGFYTDEPDLFMELLLKGLSWAFYLCRPFRRNIRGFDARYGFATADGKVQTTAVFQRGTMTVLANVVDPCTVKVMFSDVKALRGFLFSGNQDILNSLLTNDVSVSGNLNYIYRFGFMVRDLAHRLHIEL